MSAAHLDAARLRIRAGEDDPPATPSFSAFGRFELCTKPDSPYPLGLAGRSLLLEESETSPDTESLQGTYERLNGVPGSVSDPDNREATGVLVVLVDNLDPARDDDFNRWYDEVHVPDILSAGSFHWVSRYRAAGPSPVAAYLTVYETDWSDPEAAQRAMATRPNPAGLWDAIAPVHLGLYRRR